MTHSQMNNMTRAVLGALGKGVAISLVAAPFAFGQTPAPAPQKVEKIEVTGSNIKRVDSESAAPITIITAEDIKKSGATTVAEVLRDLPIANAGSLNDLATSNSFAVGASSISLRGLGAQATLILLNGRRLAAYGFANGGQQQIVNLDTLPLSAVDRVEILKDGASAIYGSEAMAGVINVILRKDYTGFDIGGSYSMNNSSLWKIQRENTSLGYGDLGKDRFNAFISFEHFKREAVNFRDSEPFLTRPQYVSLVSSGSPLSSNTFPGNYRNPTTSASLGYVLPCLGGPTTGTTCTFDQFKDISIAPYGKRDSAFGRVVWDINSNLQFFAEAAYSKNQTIFSSGPALLNEQGTSWFNLQTLGLNTLKLVFPVGNPNNPFSSPVGYRHRFMELGPQITVVDTKATRFLGGFKGSFGNWDWEAAGLSSKSDTDAAYKGRLRASALAAAIANGTYNFISSDLNANSAALRNTISPTATNVGDSSFTSFDFKLSGELFNMPGGAAGLALGAESRKEKLNTAPDNLFSSSDIVGFGASSASGSRTVNSFYAELGLPFFKTLEGQVAFRSDRYSDYGSSTTPKFGLKWKVLPSLALRATYAEGFRAPALPEVSKSLSAGFYNGFQDTVRCPTTNLTTDCQASVPVLFGANPGLKAEESKSDSLGIIWEPTKDFAMTLDWYRIDRKKEIALLDPNFLILNASRFPGYVVRGPVDPNFPNLPGPLVSFNSRYQNLGETIVTGEDLELRYSMNLGEYGKLSARTDINYVNSYKNSATENDSLDEYNGTYNQPRVRGTASLTWTYRDWTFAPSVNYVGHFKYVGTPFDVCPLAGGANANGCVISAWTTINMYVATQPIKDLTVSVSVRNIDNKQPPMDLRQGTLLFNPTYHNPYGQYWTVSANYRFK